MASSRLSSTDMFSYAFHLAATYEKSCTEIQPVLPNEDNNSFAAKFSYSDTSNIRGGLSGMPTQNDRGQVIGHSVGTATTKDVILLYPTSDTTEVTRYSAGAIPLEESLKLIDEERKKNFGALFIIPLCEARSYSGFIPWAVSWLSWLSFGLIPPMPEARQHWTLLVIEGNQCNFYDPKGTVSSSWVYSLAPVTQALKTRGITVTEHYAGQQEWDDGTHCGYFVGEFIKRNILGFVFGQSDYQIYDTKKYVSDYHASRNQSVIKKYETFCGNEAISKRLAGATTAQEQKYPGDLKDFEAKSPGFPSPRAADTKIMLRGVSHTGPITLKASTLSNASLRESLEDESVTVIPGIHPTVVNIQFASKSSATLFMKAYSSDKNISCSRTGREVTVSINTKLGVDALSYLFGENNQQLQRAVSLDKKTTHIPTQKQKSKTHDEPPSPSARNRRGSY